MALDHGHEMQWWSVAEDRAVDAAFLTHIARATHEVDETLPDRLMMQRSSAPPPVQSDGRNCVGPALYMAVSKKSTLFPRDFVAWHFSVLSVFAVF